MISSNVAYGVIQTKFTNTKKIGGVNLPDFNNDFVYSKKKTETSDEAYRKKIVEQAYEDQKNGKFQNQSDAFNKLMKQYTSEISPDREGIIKDGLTAVTKGEGKKEVLNVVATLLSGKVVYQKLGSELGYTEFYDSNGEMVATYSEKGWTMYTTKAEAARQTSMCRIYTDAWNNAKNGVPMEGLNAADTGIEKECTFDVKA